MMFQDCRLLLTSSRSVRVYFVVLAFVVWVLLTFTSILTQEDAIGTKEDENLIVADNSGSTLILDDVETDARMQIPTRKPAAVASSPISSDRERVETVSDESEHREVPRVDVKNAKPNVNNASDEDELWEAPTKEKPEYLSEFKDWKWVYPSGQNETEFSKVNFLPYESAEDCDGFCCTGETGSGGGGVKPSPGCRKNMNYMVTFVPNTAKPRAAFSLVDLIFLYRTKYPSKNMTLTFIGDSVTGQLFYGALCELLRNEQVRKVAYFKDRKLVPGMTNSWNRQWEFTEARIWLNGDSADSFSTVVYSKVYRIPYTSKEIQLVLNEFDIIIFGWGLHYGTNGKFEPFQKDLLRVVEAIRGICGDRTLVWFGAPKQHFRYKDGPRTNGFYAGEQPYQFCGPTTRFHFNDDLFDPRNRFVESVFNSHGFEARWMNWTAMEEAQCDLSQRERRLIHMFPHVELTSPFYRNHQFYHPNQSVYQHDCTHSCWAPNLYVPFWDGIYLALNATVCSSMRPTYHSGITQIPSQAKEGPTWYSNRGFEYELGHPPYTIRKIFSLLRDYYRKAANSTAP